MNLFWIVLQNPIIWTSLFKKNKLCTFGYVGKFIALWEIWLNKHRVSTWFLVCILINGILLIANFVSTSSGEINCANLLKVRRIISISNLHERNFGVQILYLLWRCNVQWVSEWVFIQVSHAKAVYTFAPFTFVVSGRILSLGEFNCLKLSLSYRNCVWANSGLGETIICKYRSAKKIRGENNPVHSTSYEVSLCII